LQNRNFKLLFWPGYRQAELIFNRALNGKAQERQQNGGEFDKPLFWVHYCAFRSLLSP
jgi:hypothetical protein